MLDNIKILLIVPTSFSIWNFRRDLIDLLLDNKFNVYVLSPYDSNFMDIKDQFASIGVKVEPIYLQKNSFNPIFDLIFFLSLIKKIKLLKPDIVLPYTIKPVVYTGIANIFFKKFRFAPTITGLGYLYTNKKNDLKRFFIKMIVKNLYRLSLSRSKVIFFQNKDDLSDLILEKIVNKNQNSVIIGGSGVNLRNFPFSPLKVNYKFLMLSRLLEDKGVREFAQAAGIVKKNYPNVSFILAGPVDKNPSSIKISEIDQWVNSGCVIYTGDSSTPCELINECMCYVLPSYREGLPRSTIEALSVGRPVITTDVPGCRETVKNNYNGFLIPPRNSELLAKAIIKIINLPRDKLMEMSIRSRELAESKFDSKIVNQEILKQIKDVSK